MKFCDIYDYQPLPASVECVCMYITYMCTSLNYTSLHKYVSALWMLHEYNGVESVPHKTFLITATLAGARRLLGDHTEQVDPLFPEDIVKIRAVLTMSNWDDFVFWVALILSFRCLLRVGHVTKGVHTLRVSDVIPTRQGLDLTISSSKTMQYKERVNRIPVLKAESVLCPVDDVLLYVKLSGLKPGDKLFNLSYEKYNSRLKLACKSIGLKGCYTSHSVRRGAANYLATFLPLHQVKQYGDWRSWAVLLYLADDYRGRMKKDQLVVKHLSQWQSA